ncbi:hypothetical protein [Treponema sp. Marseille-Q4132]|uniref:hypothetical protein n=1 Tax=Treponema sp. Marseille-Q4132 TaxID=2766701 RepID=UPI001652CFAB|nr:hypothetical protein [Treponema sp. Marseille-Q4132]QNL96507.1 hypothetical protein H9I35_08665 [Treponema sp. Marseille-Q4132]
MKNFDFKSIVLIVLLSCVFLTFSCAKEKVIRGEGNPDIDKYLKCEVKNLTEHDNLYYYPKFLIKPQRQGAYQILEYEIHYQYIFGQDWNIILDIRKRFTKEDKEIHELNEKGSFIIRCELDKIPIETVYDPSSYYGELNYNSVDVTNCYLKFHSMKKNQ